MPDLNFRVTGVEPAARGLVPLIHFHLEVTNFPETELIQAVMLQAQIQIQSALRPYADEEKEKLADLFGTPDRWGQTLRNRLWAHAYTTVRPFERETEAVLPIQCTYDLNVTATKYFYALQEGEVPLLFLFSGTIFYAGSDGRLQVQQISWDKECTYSMPVRIWLELMEHHYPNSAWLALHRQVFEKLYAYKRSQGLPTWEQTIERLLAANEPVDHR
jgi:hypothetical protein